MEAWLWWLILVLVSGGLVGWVVAWKRGWLPSSWERLTGYVITGGVVAVVAWVLSKMTRGGSTTPHTPKAAPERDSEEERGEWWPETPSPVEVEVVDGMVEETDEEALDLKARERELRHSPHAPSEPDDGVVDFLRNRSGRGGA